jgi:hypothetical protein
MTMYSDDVPRPATITISFPETSSASSFSIVKLGADGGISITANTGDPDVSLTVEGYFTSDGSLPGDGGYEPVNETRILDTSEAPLASGATLELQVTGSNGVPDGANAIFANLTVTTVGEGDGGLTVWPIEQSSQRSAPCAGTTDRLPQELRSTWARVARSRFTIPAIRR